MLAAVLWSPIAALGSAASRLPESVSATGTSVWGGKVYAGARVRYFAFGSNLLRSKMDGRGKTGVLDVVPAVVRDHRLAFNMRMFPPLEPAMASIEPAAGDVCEGALYTLTQEGSSSYTPLHPLTSP